MFENHTILVTGGTGSWGQEVIKQLILQNPKEIRVFSRNETLQVEMAQQFKDHHQIKFIIGDIRNQEELINACEGVDIVYHLAALKHVPVCENHPSEAFKTNVHGTQNVINAAIKNNVRKVVYLSTDKAADPSNIYGMTKAIGEKLMIYANTKNVMTRFICVRSGNVLGTSGSVVQVFKNQINNSRQIEITDRRMTRFFLTMEQSVQFLFKATKEGKGGEIFVMKMPACKIDDLAHVLIDESGYENIQIKEVGIRPGEKLNESLFSESESTRTKLINHDYFVILPTVPVEGLNDYYRSYENADSRGYHSETEPMTKEEIREMLKMGDLL
ncbi:FlaA1/EpsC-like NDP-sugar epimerase [Scopulibacillus daqui]|uniref:FlaA1/EpsC-like NDP-sugar epimerase n=1 Tax=Scopulibacillus daqui TaxID=1469162 RepID=A0ABS2Q609_9BACL|nr:polysaccharide biosynthesis protein [Scopulibacillus daqui]MBM7646942.1 FlaA1/EpsC-like NDP-sugar epimerase [Scopulibacillus daqui]